MSVIAPAFVPEPVSVPISIEDGMVPKVQFFMKPTGYIRGYIAKNEQPYMQAGKSRQPDTEIEIQSITLRGNGTYRTLTPLQEEEISYDEIYPEHYLSETDFTAQGTFFFFGLSAGVYELTITAKGYKKYSKMCNVRLGEYKDTMIIELVEEITDSP